MAADHSIIRKGANQILGVTNEDVLWRIVPAGFKIEGHYKTLTLSVAGPYIVVPTVTAYLDRMGSIWLLTLPGFSQNGTQGGSINFAAGSIPVEARPSVQQTQAIPVIINGDTVGGMLRINTDGSVSFYFQKSPGSLAVLAPTVGQAGGWKGCVVSWSV